jgi:pimeloyl-ACP methyl ester carboxylesterase
LKTLVTIPGIMSDARTWEPVADGLQNGFNCKHVADTSRDNSLEGMAIRVLEAVEGELVILSHSMGGRIAMEIGRLAPERVRGIVLSNTGHKAAAEGEESHRMARIAEANADMKTYATNWVPKVVAPANAQNRELVSRIEAMVEGCPADVHARQNLALLKRPDASVYLGRFSFPVLLITGSEDKLSPPALHDEIAALIPDAETVVIAGAGHLLPFERPDEVLETVRDWLSRKVLAET